MARPIIIAITGMPASGKSTCAEHIAKKKGVARIQLSDFIWNWLEKEGISKSNTTGAMYGLFLHTIYHSTPIIKWAKKKIKKCTGADVIVLDTVRTLKVYNTFKSKYEGRFVLIAVLASQEIRKARQIERARFGQRTTESGFHMRDSEELEIGVGSVIALADEYINANVSKEETLKQVDEVYERVLKNLKKPKK